jgi:Ca-activated chloride channel family protein
MLPITTTMRFWTVRCSLVLAFLLGAGCVGLRQPQVFSPSTGSIEGVVWDESSSIADAHILLEQNGRIVATARTGESERFQFDRLPHGDYLVLIASDGFVPALRRVTVRDRPIRLLVALDEARPLDTGPVPNARVHSPNAAGATIPPPSALGAWPTNTRIAPSSPDPFRLTAAVRTSTLGGLVDSVSFIHVRSLLTRFRILPMFDAIRTDELLNYFNFKYPEPRWGEPISITTEIGPCPWTPDHRLALVGLRARPIADWGAKPRRIVLVLDHAAGQDAPFRQSMLRAALRSFVDTLRDEDRLAIVIHGGGLVLPSTPGSGRAQIHHAIEFFQGGGPSFSAMGVPLAYEVAREHFAPWATNRVVLATDDRLDENLQNQAELLELVAQEQQRGIDLSVLDIGTGTLREEETVKTLVERGSARYSYVESVPDALRALVVEGGGVFQTTATDVSFQVEFNPAHVAAWKLIGYQNRTPDDSVEENDRGGGRELVSGDSVTALYEIVPVKSSLPRALVGEFPIHINQLGVQPPSPAADGSRELFTVKVRYTPSSSSRSRLLTHAAREGGSRQRVQLAANVAEFAQLLIDGDTSPSRWRALGQRVDHAEPAFDSPDQNDLSSLVRLAAHSMQRYPLQTKNHLYRQMPDGREWTTENVNLDVVDVGRYCADPARHWETCQRDGQLYTWPTAFEACEALGPGWRLPTNEDWRLLAKSAGGVRDDSSDQGAKAYAALVNRGRAGFNVALAGGRTADGQYEHVGAHGFYWTATERDANRAWFYDFGGSKMLSRHSDGEKTRALSVRCVRN